MRRAIAGVIIIFLRDAQSGFVWSAGYQPTGVEPESYEVSFFEDRAEFVRRDGSLTTKLEVVVSPEDDAEMRRVSITNLGTRPREIQVTSYAELCLAPQAADVAHPAFSNLFVETEFVSDVRRAGRHAPQAIRQGNAGVGRARRCGGRRNRRRTAIRNGPLALFGPRTRCTQSCFDL